MLMKRTLGAPDAAARRGAAVPEGIGRVPGGVERAVPAAPSVDDGSPHAPTAPPLAPPQSYTIEGWRELLEQNGPLWLGVAVPSGHAVVITGLSGDGTPEGTIVRYDDP